jgi:hypothetical protein
VILSSVDKLFHYANVNRAKLVELAAGDVVKGKVIKLFPNQTAVVQINGSSLVAQLHAPLMNHTAYWFEVQPKINNQLQLKVLAHHQGLPVQGEKIIPLLKELHLPPTKINEKLVLSLTEKGLPLPRKALLTISNWLSSSANVDLDLQAIGQMIERKLPFTKETFLSTRSLYDGSSFAKQLQTLFSFLESQDALTGEEMQLKEIVSRLLFPMQYKNGTEVAEKFPFLSGEKWLGEAKELAKAFKLLFQSLGLEYEREIIQHFKNHPDNALKDELHSLKALLLQFKQQHISGPERALADQLIHKITGYQLLAREDGPITSLYMQLPLLLGNELHDVTIQWEGRRKEEGEIDPGYCRILFCLQLAYLKETIVDVTVQNRVVNIGIMNDHPLLPALTKQLWPKLKENLSALHYHLSDVKVITSVKEQQSRGLLTKQGNVYQQSSPYSGVDIKV